MFILSRTGRTQFVDMLFDIFENNLFAGVGIIALFAIYLALYFYLEKLFKQEKISKLRYNVILYSCVAIFLTIASVVAIHVANYS